MTQQQVRNNKEKRAKKISEQRAEKKTESERI
jgi:hypothetical protein